MGIHVSIHAPREGRRTARAISLSSTGFNPRPHARGDFGSPLRSCAIKMFQSTPHTRGDEAGKPHLTGSLSFNPRPHTRGDPIGGINVLPQRVSIHAPTRGATFEKGLNVRDFKFQSTPPRGGRLRIQKVTLFRKTFHLTFVSIHAPARGATFMLANAREEFTFQSTPPRGGRHTKTNNSLLFPCFNPRPRAGGDVA